MTVAVNRLAGLAVAGLAVAMAACTSASAGPEPTRSPATAVPAAERPASTLTVWAEAAIAPALESLGAKHRAATGVRVVVNPYPLEEMLTDLPRVAPRGLGPDLLVGSSDWVGTLAQAGLITPVATRAEARFRPVALASFTFQDRRYGVPVATTAPALIRNTDLVPDPPQSLGDMVDTGMRLKRAKQVDLPIALPVGRAGDGFTWYPLYAAAGGYLFARDRDGGYDPEAIGVGMPAGVRAARTLATLAERGVIDPGLTRRAAIRSFRSGRSAFLIADPAAVDRLTGTGTPFAVGPVPGDGSRAPGPPLVAAKGFMMSTFARDPRAAREFLEGITTTPAMELLTGPGTQVPAWTEAAAAAGADPVLAGLTAAQDAGRPAPNLPVAVAAWRILGQAQVEVLRGVDPKRVMTAAEARIAGAVSAQ